MFWGEAKQGRLGFGVEVDVRSIIGIGVRVNGVRHRDLFTGRHRHQRHQAGEATRALPAEAGQGMVARPPEPRHHRQDVFFVITDTGGPAQQRGSILHKDAHGPQQDRLARGSIQPSICYLPPYLPKWSGARSPLARSGQDHITPVEHEVTGSHGEYTSIVQCVSNRQHNAHHTRMRRTPSRRRWHRHRWHLERLRGPRQKAYVCVWVVPERTLECDSGQYVPSTNPRGAGSPPHRGSMASKNVDQGLSFSLRASTTVSCYDLVTVIVGRAVSHVITRHLGKSCTHQ